MKTDHDGYPTSFASRSVRSWFGVSLICYASGYKATADPYRSVRLNS